MELEQDEESGGLNLNSKETNLNLNRNFFCLFFILLEDCSVCGRQFTYA